MLLVAEGIFFRRAV